MHFFKTFFILVCLLSVSGSALADIRLYTCRFGSSVVKLSVDSSNLKNLDLEASIRPDVQLGISNSDIQNISFALGELDVEDSRIVGSTVLLNFKSGSAEAIQIIQLLPGMPYQMMISPAADVIEAQNPGIKVSAGMWPYECN
ncbi:MAG: hypothetical protein SGJ18_08565 [Pseudomonadota bacterium]|nr:hypothetical protein [Pseudomonadota bacterium]